MIKKGQLLQEGEKLLVEELRAASLRYNDSNRDRGDEGKQMIRGLRRSVAVAGLACLAWTISMASASSVALAARPARSEFASASSWERTIRALLLAGTGCFTATFPIARWHKVTCQAAPDVPYGPETADASITLNGGRRRRLFGGVGRSFEQRDRVLSRRQPRNHGDGSRASRREAVERVQPSTELRLLQFDERVRVGPEPQ